MSSFHEIGFALLSELLPKELQDIQYSENQTAIIVTHKDILHI